MNSKNRFILIKLLGFEFILLNLVVVLYLFFRVSEFSFTDTVFLMKMAKLAIIYNLSWLFIILYIRGEDFYFNSNHGYIRSLFISLFFFVGFVTTLIVLLTVSYFSRSTFILPIFIFCYLDLISHKYLFKHLKTRGADLFSNALLLGSGHEHTDLNNFSNAMSQYGYNIIGYLQDGNKNIHNSTGLTIFGNITELQNILSANSINDIFIETCEFDREKVTEAIKIADSFGVRVKLIPDNPLLFSKNFKAVAIGDLVVFKLRQSPLDSFSKTILKRLFDFCFALLAIILCAPLFLLIALLIIIDSRGPVFYNPHRKGEAGEIFRCHKFRTMSVSEDPINCIKSTIINDPRITRIGKLLRKCDLDELPQFYNVLKGEMSVIGPRPHRIRLQDDFRKTVNDYMVRSYVKPGITGWAQVNGWRGPTDTDEQKNERVAHDLWYIANWSLWLDVKIVFLTLFGRHRKNAF